MHVLAKQLEPTEPVEAGVRVGAGGAATAWFLHGCSCALLLLLEGMYDGPASECKALMASGDKISQQSVWSTAEHGAV